jgi:DNA-binding GntR family transcriptional regulator
MQCYHGLRRETIVQSVLTDVFQGRLRAGKRLVTQELAERFGVSHTPIREALIALAGMGIVDLLPNRGALVRRVAAKDVYEICQVRKVLECAAVRRACGRIQLAQLHGLADDIRHLMADSAVHNGNGRNGKKDKRGEDARPTPSVSQPAAFIAQARALDSRLHDLVADSCGNAFLAKEIGRLKILFRAFRDIAWEHDEARNDFHRLAEEAREHLAIVEALLVGDPKQASRAMARHIRSGAKYWSRAMPASANGEPQESGTRLRKRSSPR